MAAVMVTSSAICNDFDALNADDMSFSKILWLRQAAALQRLLGAYNMTVLR
jgi:hypothetical protein